MPGPDVQRDLQDRHHGPGHPSHDDQVDRQGEIDRAEPPQNRGGLAAVADLRELEIGQDAGPTPEAGEEEDGQDPRDRAVPPEPVPRDPVLGDQAGDHERRIGGEGGRHHRGAGEPPGEGPARGEVLLQRFAGATGIDQGDHGRGDEVQQHDQPVRERERHGASRVGDGVRGTARLFAPRPSLGDRAGGWKWGACPVIGAAPASARATASSVTGFERQPIR